MVLQAEETFCRTEGEERGGLGRDVGHAMAVVPGRDVLTSTVDLQRVPLANRTTHARVGSRDVIDRRRVLIVLQLEVPRRGVIENLDLESGRWQCVVVAMMVAVLRDADVHAAVASRRETVFEPQIEVVELLTAAQPRSLLSRADQQTIHH